MSKPTGKDEVLKWDVFVTPGIPIASPSRPAGVRETFFQATASTLIYGKRDAVLVDTFMTVDQAKATAQQLYEQMLEVYPTRVNPGWALWNSARAVKP